MPLVRVTYPCGALTPEQKRQLASDLTEIVLEAEVDAVTAAGRMVNADLDGVRRAEISASLGTRTR
jgi:hypothetical protein